MDRVIDVIRKASSHVLASTNLMKDKLLIYEYVFSIPFRAAFFHPLIVVASAMMCKVIIIVLYFHLSNALFDVAEFSLTDKQAEAILDISLRKITSLEKNKFIDEEKS